MNKGEIIIYQTTDGSISLDVKLEQDTIWLTQKQIAELFGTKRPAITKHLKNIFYRVNWRKIWYVPFWNIPLDTVQ